MLLSEVANYFEDKQFSFVTVLFEILIIAAGVYYRKKPSSDKQQ